MIREHKRNTLKVATHDKTTYCKALNMLNYDVSITEVSCVRLDEQDDST